MKLGVNLLTVAGDLNDLVYILDKKGRILFANRAFKGLIGSRITTFPSMLTVESKDIWNQNFRRLKKGTRTPPIEITIQRANEQIVIRTKEKLIDDGKRVLGIAQDLTLLKRLEHRLIQQFKEQEVLNSLSQIINRTMDINQLLKHGLEEIINLTDTDAGIIYLYDDRTDLLNPMAFCGLPEWIVQKSRPISRSQGVYRSIFRISQIIGVENPGYRIRKQGFRHLIIIPLKARKEIVGVLNLLYKKRIYPEREFLSKIGNQLGSAIENLRLIEEREEKISYLSALNQIGRILGSEFNLVDTLEYLYSQVKKILKPRNFCVSLYLPDEDKFEVLLKYKRGKRVKGYRFPFGYGMSSHIIRTKKPLFTRDYMKECRRLNIRPYGTPAKCWLGAPMLIKGKPIGLIYIWDEKKTDAFNPDDLDLLNTIAAQAAIAVENTRQYQRLSKQLKEQELVFDVGQSITSILDLNILLNHIIHMITKTFGFRYIAILLYDKEREELYIKATGGLITEKIRKIRLPISKKQGISVQAFKSGRVYYVPDVTKDPYYVEYLKATRSNLAIPLIVRDETIGVLNIESSKRDAFDAETINILSSIAAQASVAIENAQLYQEIEASYFDTVKALVLTIEAKDKYTKGHSERVTNYAIRIAKELKLPDSEIKKLTYAGLLHDIGKIGIKDQILTKAGPLTSKEWKMVRRHPIIGYGMIKDIGFLEGVSGIIRAEHERFDGDGYPNGIKARGIPVGARILSVADAYDAMTSNRPYRPALSQREAIAELKKNAGSQFDPDVVRVFLSIIKRSTPKSK